MTYDEAIAHLYALGQELAPTPDGKASRRKFDLDEFRRLMAALDDPQQRFPSVLIAGTNGKGSTAATLASIVAAAGYRTALYTSPHLSRVNERIQVSQPVDPGEYASTGAPRSGGPHHLLPIAEADFARLYERVIGSAEELVASSSLPQAPSFFEVLTALAFLYFAEQAVELAVLEVGLGGRLDATNIVTPLVSVITDIALDHQEYLGDTLTAIAGEKCGILRHGGLLVTLPQHPEVNQAIGEAAIALDCRAINAADYLPLRDIPTYDGTELPPNRYRLTLGGEPLLIDSPLPGEHQQRNIALALATVVALRGESSGAEPEGAIQTTAQPFQISIAEIEAGVRSTAWPGRLERLSLSTHDYLLDVAHNPAGAWTLRAALAKLPERQPRTLIFSCLRDKNLDEMARILFPLFDSSSYDRPHDHIVLAPIANPRAAPIDDLLAVAHRLDTPAHAAPHVLAALTEASNVTPAGGLIVVTGSVYLVGEARDLLLAAHQLAEATR
jgi:dihydrofolate synthase/folylpolyglutamate synthase